MNTLAPFSLEEKVCRRWQSNEVACRAFLSLILPFERFNSDFSCLFRPFSEHFPVPRSNKLVNLGGIGSAL